MPGGNSEDFGLDRLEDRRSTGDPDATTAGPFDNRFPLPHVGGSWGDPTDPKTYGPGADKLRDKNRDLTPNGYYSFHAFYLVLYENQGQVNTPKQRIIFPVVPATFGVGQQRSYGTYDLIAGKQGMQIGQMQLRQISFSSFFPAVFDEDYCIGHYLDYCGNSNHTDPDPMIAVNYIYQKMRSEKPVYFAGLGISQGNQEPGQTVFPEMACHITNFNYSYQQGEPRDIYYDIELTEHRDLKVVRTKGKPPSGPKEPDIKKVTSRIGDSFIDIAKQVYGANYGSLASKIKAANPDVKVGVGSSIKPGTTIKIPKVSETAR